MQDEIHFGGPLHQSKRQPAYPNIQAPNILNICGAQTFSQLLDRWVRKVWVHNLDVPVEAAELETFDQFFLIDEFRRDIARRQVDGDWDVLEEGATLEEFCLTM